MIFYHFQLFSEEIVKKAFSIISIPMMFLPGPRFDFLFAFPPAHFPPLLIIHPPCAPWLPCGPMPAPGRRSRGPRRRPPPPNSFRPPPRIPKTPDPAITPLKIIACFFSGWAWGCFSAPNNIQGGAGGGDGAHHRTSPHDFVAPPEIDPIHSMMAGFPSLPCECLPPPFAKNEKGLRDVVTSGTALNTPHVW